MTLEAKNLTFRYPHGGSAPVLDGVSLTLRSGERLGLSAPSGRGKTTLCKLLAGWEKPASGQALLEGVRGSVENLQGERDALAARIAGVLAVFLFHASVRYRLASGDMPFSLLAESLMASGFFYMIL